MTDPVGYLDGFSYQVGDIAHLYVDSPTPYGVELVRLWHGDENPEGPGLREASVCTLAQELAASGDQETARGSHIAIPASIGSSCDLRVTVSLRCDTPATRSVGLLRVEAETVAVAIRRTADGGVDVTVDDADTSRDAPLTTHQIRPKQWSTLKLTICRRLRLVELLIASFDGASSDVIRRDLPTDSSFGRTGITIGATQLRATQGGGTAALDAMDGRVAEVLVEATEGPGCRLGGDGALHKLFEQGRSFDARGAMVNMSAGTAHARLVNGGRGGLRGPRWTHRSRPHGADHNAIGLASDSITDAAWAAAMEWQIPELDSGVYALKLQGAEGAADRVPLVVLPDRQASSRDVLVVLPSYTYLAYANQRYAPTLFDGRPSTPGYHDRLSHAHPEWGVSCYDRHPDGSGVSKSSWLRPIPNLRPDYRFWITGAPERLSADLYLIDWLDHIDVTHDVITDRELEHWGPGFLSRYRVVLTGSHPEYATEGMLDALETYVWSGGRIMYLGGNGFYWVTSSGNDGREIEVRRGLHASRAWTGEPTEHFHDDGQEGGLWRYRGRSPQSLLGVGSTAHGNGTPAPGYRRLPDSYDADVAWVFEGVDVDSFGGYGLMVGGAAGYETDRHDVEQGSRADDWLLATSGPAQFHDYYPMVEDVEMLHRSVASSTSPQVRADMVLRVNTKGGAVFSSGAIAWTSALSHNDYDNEVARISANVLRGFRTRPQLAPSYGRLDR